MKKQCPIQQLKKQLAAAKNVLTRREKAFEAAKQKLDAAQACFDVLNDRMKKIDALALQILEKEVKPAKVDKMTLSAPKTEQNID